MDKDNNMCFIKHPGVSFPPPTTRYEVIQYNTGKLTSKSFTRDFKRH